MSEKKLTDLDGFLSQEIDSYIKDIHSNNTVWFGFANKVNRFGENLLLHIEEFLTVGSLPNAKVILLLLLVRNMSNFQGVLLLTERGMIIEARTLARSCLENLFYVAAIVNDKSFINKLRNDNIKHSKGRANLLLDSSMRKLLESEKIEQLIEYLKQDINNKEAQKVLSVPDVAKAAGQDIQMLYVIYKQLSADSAHPSFDSLNRYLEDKVENKKLNILDRPMSDSFDIPSVLSISCMTTISIYELILRIIKIDFSDDLKELFDEYLVLDKTTPKKPFIKTTLLGI